MALLCRSGASQRPRLRDLTWAAALAAQTSYSAVMSTCHVPIVHPLLAAKAAATIDCISGGRFALNIVCGWFEPEIEMFNAPRLDHDERYRFADEWITIVKRLWSEQDYFDVAGTHVKLQRAMSQPKPIQTAVSRADECGRLGHGPAFRRQALRPRLCHSAQGRRSRHLKQQVDDYRDACARGVRPRSTGLEQRYVAQADSYDDAVKYVDYYAVEHGDDPHVDAFIAESITRSRVIDPAALEKLRYSIKAGTGGVPLLGTAQDIAAQTRTCVTMRLDGLLLVWMDFQNGIRQFQ